MKTLFNSSRRLISARSYSYGAVSPCSKKPSYPDASTQRGGYKI